MRCASYNTFTSAGKLRFRKASNALDVRRTSASDGPRSLDEIKPVIEVPQEMRNLLRRHTSVRVEHHDDVPAGSFEPGSKGRSFAWCTLRDDPNIRAALYGHSHSGVSRIPVYEYHVVDAVGHGFQHQRKVASLIARGNDETHPVSHRSFFGIEPDGRGTMADSVVADSQVDRVCVRRDGHALSFLTLTSAPRSAFNWTVTCPRVASEAPHGPFSKPPKLIVEPTQFEVYSCLSHNETSGQVVGGGAKSVQERPEQAGSHHDCRDGIIP